MGPSDLSDICCQEYYIAISQFFFLLHAHDKYPQYCFVYVALTRWHAHAHIHINEHAHAHKDLYTTVNSHHIFVSIHMHKRRMRINQPHKKCMHPLDWDGTMSKESAINNKQEKAQTWERVPNIDDLASILLAIEKQFVSLVTVVNGNATHTKWMDLHS